jgi:hypothetical protein
MSGRFMLFFVLIVMVSACSSSKKLVSPVARDHSKNEIWAALQQHNKNFQWFHGKASAQIRTAGESQSVHMVIRMLRDSAVWVQIKKFEIEAFRLLVTPQDYTLLHRLESGYERGSVTKLSEMAGVDLTFEDVQQLIFGNIVLPEDQNFAFVREGDNYKVSFTSGNWSFEYVLDAFRLQVQKALVSDDSGKTMRIVFSEYKQALTGPELPHIREIYFPEKPGTEGVIRLDFSELEVDVAKELKFVVPSHYHEFE